MILESKISSYNAKQYESVACKPPQFSLDERPFEWSSDLPLKMKDDSAFMIARKEAATKKKTSQ